MALKKNITPVTEFYEGPAPKAFGNKTKGGFEVVDLFVPLFPQKKYPLVGYVKGFHTNVLFHYKSKGVTVVFYDVNGNPEQAKHSDLALTKGNDIKVRDIRKK